MSRMSPESSLAFQLEEIRSKLDEIEELIDNFETFQLETQFKHLIWAKMRADDIIQACIIGVDKICDMSYAIKKK